MQPVVEDARHARVGRARVPRRGDGAQREHDRGRRGARAPVAQQRGGEQRHHDQRAPDPGEVARQVVAHPPRVDPAGGVGRVGDRRHDGGRHRGPRHVPAQAPFAGADLVEVHPPAAVAGVELRHRPAARAADQQRQQQRRGEHEDRGVERDAGEDPHPARARQRPGLERGRRAGVRAHAERERALERVAVLRGDRVPVDPVGARGELARGREHEPPPLGHAQGGRHRSPAADGSQRRTGQPPVQRLGEDEHDPLRRRLEPLPGRGLGAHVGGMAEGGRRPRERDGEDGGQGEETAHPAGLRV